MAMQIVKALFLIAIPPYRETPEEGVLPPGRGKLLLVVLLALAGNQEQNEHSASHYLRFCFQHTDSLSFRQTYKYFSFRW